MFFSSCPGKNRRAPVHRLGLEGPQEKLGGLQEAGGGHRVGGVKATSASCPRGALGVREDQADWPPVLLPPRRAVGSRKHRPRNQGSPSCLHGEEGLVAGVILLNFCAVHCSSQTGPDASTPSHPGPVSRIRERASSRVSCAHAQLPGAPQVGVVSSSPPPTLWWEEHL